MKIQFFFDLSFILYSFYLNTFISQRQYVIIATSPWRITNTDDPTCLYFQSRYEASTKPHVITLNIVVHCVGWVNSLRRYQRLLVSFLYILAHNFELFLVTRSSGNGLLLVLVFSGDWWHDGLNGKVKMHVLQSSKYLGHTVIFEKFLTRGVSVSFLKKFLTKEMAKKWWGVRQDNLHSHTVDMLGELDF